MKTVYPVVISKDGKSFMVSVPDLKINTQGENFADAIEMARKVILNWCMNEQYLPSSTAINDIKREADDIVTLVDIDLKAYRRKIENRTVKKCVTIPAWLSEQAEKAHINCSQTLQRALKEELNVSK